MSKYVYKQHPKVRWRFVLNPQHARVFEGVAKSPFAVQGSGFQKSMMRNKRFKTIHQFLVSGVASSRHSPVSLSLPGRPPRTNRPHQPCSRANFISKHIIYKLGSMKFTAHNELY